MVSATTASIRIRPIRFGFLVNPQDRTALRQVFRLNTVLWGGVYNFIIPAFKKTPQRYSDRPFKTPSANEMVNGLIDAFQPDFIVEMKQGIAAPFRFPSSRVISMEQLTTRDEHGRCSIGIDMRSICTALYDETFRFVQRHPQKVVIPQSSDKRFELLFAAMFGQFPTEGPLDDCIKHFEGALDAKKESIAPTDFPRLFGENYLFPLRVGRHELETHRRGWRLDPHMFYMDESSGYDLIEFWNLRAIGWQISPLPHALAEYFTAHCEKFIAESYKPFPPPSNAFQRAGFLCSRSCDPEELKSFMAGLKRPAGDGAMLTLDTRFPRIWEEWGRSADHAEPQDVTNEVRSVEADLSAHAFYLRTAFPDFLELAPYAASQYACANVLESVPGGAAVIPWQDVKLDALAERFADERTWLSREGVVTTAGESSISRFLRAPSPINVFTAFAEGHNFKLELSPAGQTCEQVIAALGGLQWVRLVANDGILKLLNQLAHGDYEIEVTDANSKVRRVRTISAPYQHIQKTLMQATEGNAKRAAHRLKGLLRCNVLKLGMRLGCTECSHKSWFGLEDLAAMLKCPRCLRLFSLPVESPSQTEWAYRAIGPFAVGDFALGSYCVAMTLQFLAEEIGTASTWIPSFKLSRSGPPPLEIEADFGMFLRPTIFSHVTSPFVVLGECKTYGAFDKKDFKRARDLAKLFPGSVLCFATLRNTLDESEKRNISRIAQVGRASWKTGRQRNPVLVLTATELFGQFKIGKFTDDYGTRSQQAERLFQVRDLQELCDFTQQVHLGMESIHVWRDKKRQRLAARAHP